MWKPSIAVSALLVAAAALAAPGTASAMEEITPHIGFGFSIPMGGLGDVVDYGWRVNGGVTFFPSKKPIGFRVDVALDNWSLSDSFLDQIDTDPRTDGIQPPGGGTAKSLEAMFNVLWEPPTSGFWGYYLTGGLGAYHLTANVSEDGTLYAYYCDPWFCYPTVFPTQFVIADRDSWEWGLNAGGGLTYQLMNGAQFYIEATYQWLGTEQTVTWVPLQVGWRW
jgi:Outer membrane protein beta-barrel domain